jgi:hypothetical protein
MWTIIHLFASQSLNRTPLLSGLLSFRLRLFVSTLIIFFVSSGKIFLFQNNFFFFFFLEEMTVLCNFVCNIENG